MEQAVRTIIKNYKMVSSLALDRLSVKNPAPFYFFIPQRVSRAAGSLFSEGQVLKENPKTHSADGVCSLLVLRGERGRGFAGKVVIPPCPATGPNRACGFHSREPMGSVRVEMSQQKRRSSARRRGEKPFGDFSPSPCWPCLVRVRGECPGV